MNFNYYFYTSIVRGGGNGIWVLLFLSPIIFPHLPCIFTKSTILVFSHTKKEDIWQNNHIPWGKSWNWSNGLKRCLRNWAMCYKNREGIERKLSTSYSLGRDGGSSRPKSLLPLYNGKTRSYYLQGAKKESVVVFFFFF